MKGTRNRLASLLQSTKRGVPLTSDVLNSLGITPDVAYQYVKKGYLTKLGHGAYSLAGDVIDQYGVAKAVLNLYPHMHVAARSALAFNGYYQNIYANPILILFGEERKSLPLWTKPYRLKYRCASALFDFQGQEGRSLNESTIEVSPYRPHSLKCSVPERALLEMLYEVGKDQDYEEAKNIIGGMSGLRSDVMGALLQRCRSLKTLRLLVKMTKEVDWLGFNAQDLIASLSISLGSEYRWSVRGSDGSRILI